ncbi:MAG: ABC transporter ATP-binding protein [Pseudomonadota bacterium]
MAEQTPPRLALSGITVSYGGVPAVTDMSLTVGAGEIVCLLGPSGCGKSSTLRVSAGVERQAAGSIGIDGIEVSDGKARHDPPEARSVGLMFQDYALFPHLSVAENIGFGLRKTPGAERRRIAGDYLARVGLDGFARKYPHQLSGGEQQRVALARALAPRPRVMLMDEPFSGLDQRLRDEVRDETLAILKDEGAGVLLVTHEPDEAMRMADRIALMRDGRVVQVGAPYDLYHDPVDRQTAAFFSDLNVIETTVAGGGAETPFGRFPAAGLTDGTAVEFAVRPQHLTIATEDGRAPPAGAARGHVLRARFVGAQSLIAVAMEHGGAVMQATVPDAWQPQAGTPIWLSLRRDRCFLFPRVGAGSVASPRAAE